MSPCLPAGRVPRRTRGMRPGLPAIMTLIGFGCLGLAAAAEIAPHADTDATDSLRRALAVDERRQGATSPLLLPALERLGQARWRAGDLAESTALRRRALDIAIRAFGSNSASAAEAMSALAQVDIDRRRYLDAEPLLIAAANILTTSVEPDHPALGAVCAALARIAMARGATQEAEGWAERAVGIAAKNPHQRAAEPLLALAVVRAVQQRFGESEQLVQDAVARDRRHYGSDGAATARSLSQLGNLFLRQRRYTEALPPLQQAASIDQRALAPTHPFVADDFYDLGLTFDGLKRAEEARRSLSFAVKLLESSAEKNSLRLAYAQRELARVLRAAGKGDAADAAAADSKRILNKAEEEERERERQI
jgi:tetratricopeptide (TPR) repeat protein